MTFENLKSCIKSNWLLHSDFECIIDPITKEHTFIAGCIFYNVKMKNIQKIINRFLIYKNMRNIYMINYNILKKLKKIF